MVGADHIDRVLSRGREYTTAGLGALRRMRSTDNYFVVWRSEEAQEVAAAVAGNYVLLLWRESLRIKLHCDLHWLQ